MRRFILAVLTALLMLPTVAYADNPHRVRRGETLSAIAADHNTSVRRLVRLNPRKIKNRDLIYPGQRLRVRGKATSPSRPRRPRVCVRTWPVPGRTVYTYPGHNGVDINRGFGWQDYGDPIRSASCGRVTYVGWGRGYGDAIFVRTRRGEVVYGHTSSQSVRSGERVRSGELLGRVGSTGNSTAPHLHFGFVRNGTYQRALNFLTGGGRGGGPKLKIVNVADLARADGTGIFKSEPRTSRPWSVRWRPIAMCESTRRWHINTGNGYYGGLQFWPPTWNEHGGRQFARMPHRATHIEQKRVAERVLRTQGLGAWPVCGVRGIRR